MSDDSGSTTLDNRQTTFDLRSLKPGWRSLYSLRGDIQCVWLDSSIGRAAARIAAALRINTQASWPGPIANCRPTGTPALSWSVVPIAACSPQSFSEFLDRSLAEYSHDAQTSIACDVTSLMRRMREQHALDPLHRLPACPDELREQSHGPHVLIINERERNPFSSLTRTERQQAFRTMVRQAIAAHPSATFWIGDSTHGGSGKWLSTYAADLIPPSIRRLRDRETLSASIDHVDYVYTVCAPEGMHALLAGIPLHVFGAPYYAGWGLTHDAHRFPHRCARPSLATFFDVFFLRITRYLDPATHRPGDLGALLDAIALQRQVARRFANTGPLASIGFQWWKRPFATPFLSACGETLRWTDDVASIRADECAVIWGGRSAPNLPDDRRRIRIEDGFLHSLGLGSDMVAPHSQVIDTRGLYFDASRPSDLSVLLNEATFQPDELSRAVTLRDSIVKRGLTKYNLGRQRPRWKAPAAARVILVPGQVADDASIRLGTRAITTADALLREVRAARPDAWIVYKPHPDVLSGNRQGLVHAKALANVVDIEADLISLIEAADEVHTLSSLSGFEALLRGKAVFTYGLPFYAGWGLTHDAIEPMPWRERTLTLDMLIAGVLLRYPLYWDWKLRLFTTPERVVHDLAPHAGRPLAPVRSGPMRLTRKIFRWTRNALLHLVWRVNERRRK
ncbi:capsular polysaccharide biosynthesis protein [Paraburkholderia eburnea]|nr:capsular biosynthesis protein [Paraburkholderia eburnea]